MNFYQCKIFTNNYLFFTNNYLFFTTQYWIFTINVKITQNRAQSFIKLCNCIVCSPKIYRTIQTLFVDLKKLLIIYYWQFGCMNQTFHWMAGKKHFTRYTFASFLDNPNHMMINFCMHPLNAYVLLHTIFN